MSKEQTKKKSATSAKGKKSSNAKGTVTKQKGSAASKRANRNKAK